MRLQELEHGGEKLKPPPSGEVIRTRNHFGTCVSHDLPQVIRRWLFWFILSHNYDADYSVVGKVSRQLSECPELTL